MRTTIFTASILTCLGLISSTVSHAGPKTHTAEDLALAAGTWTYTKAGKTDSTSLSIDLEQTSIVVPTLSSEALASVVFTSESGHLVYAESGESIKLDAGSYTMNVSTEGRTIVGAYIAGIHDMTVQRLTKSSGELVGYAFHLNPALLKSDVIRDSLGERLNSATMIMTTDHLNLVVEGKDDTLVIEYAAESDEGRTFLTRDGLGELDSTILDLSALDEALSSDRFDPTQLPLNDIYVDDVITSSGLDLGEEVAGQLIELMADMEELAAEIEETGTHGGFVGGLFGGTMGGILGGVSAGPGGAWAGGTVGRWAGSQFEDSVVAAFRDDDGDGLANAFDPDMDGDGIPNHKDDDIDGDNTPNDEDDHPRDKKRSISAETEGPMVPTWLVDTPVGDENITFDIQIDSILDDLDALEDFGVMMSGTH